MTNTHTLIKSAFTVLIALFCNTAAMAQVDGVKPSDKEKEDIIAGVDMSHWNFDLRAGYSIGGTVPFDMPAEIRRINSFSPKFNYRFGLDIEYRFNENWGLLSGLYLERKGFEGDMTAKQYDITIRQGGEEISGPFTGKVSTTIVQTGLTLPVQASWYINRKLKVRFGFYFCLITDRDFHGYAYGEPDGNGNYTAYLRQGSSQGPLVYIGNDDDSRGTFEGDTYNDYMRRFQLGADVGTDLFFSRHWGIFADLSLGFNSAFNDKSGNPVNMPLYPIYGTFGVVYKIGR